jgi:hypothetical protein
MPITGRSPKPAGQIRHRNPRVHDWIDVTDVPFNGGPPLPPHRAKGEPWPEEAVRTWSIWRRMPHCVLWRKSDWRFALQSLEVAARFYESESASLARELRDREQVLGTTLDYRRALRIRYLPVGAVPAPVVGEQGSVADIAGYRNL